MCFSFLLITILIIPKLVLSIFKMPLKIFLVRNQTSTDSDIINYEKLYGKEEVNIDFSDKK